ncbi:MAG: hypothetical protein A3I05_01845 [Deltaproteobacteria bacterium RIFCSPLOWO2_02_FULL_44_10]|nr:MAG: hypothetical protein A3C46_04865 [Deltaproteobacteria bacterium RIFCSPHIGHO2_02_FULL_44_16]OGQ44952.1 MAG: hypothetical protein A3I05_01845 [Deltaproteobacteria bacterium RIFCSPLOWO2_02_FULL_44_10]
MNFYEMYSLFRRFYHVAEAPEKIDSYLITSLSFPATSLFHHIGHRLSHRETLFVREEENAVELGLYIAPEILQHLEDHRASLDDIACATEGISHFLYIVDRASKNQSCTLLELELQAEVDKFLSLHHLALTSHQSCDSLFRQLFENFTYDDALTTEEKNRYQTAHHLAAHYCHYLQERYFHPLRKAELAEEARRFFQKRFPEKMKYLIA